MSKSDTGRNIKAANINIVYETYKLSVGLVLRDSRVGSDFHLTF